jgi:hypothetical protein
MVGLGREADHQRRPLRARLGRERRQDVGVLDEFKTAP